MNILIVVVLFFVLSLAPVYAQEFANPTLTLQEIQIPAQDFNRVRADAEFKSFEKPHPGNWQVTIQNNLLYANPKGNAVLRLYDANDHEKYIDIGMGSPPERRFWAAFNLPDIGYIPATKVDVNGWSPDSKIIAAHGDSPGITISNGKRIVVSNVDLNEFAVGGYAVYGMDERSDPPAINSGTFTIDIMSGDVSKNPFHYYPFIVSGAVGALIGILLLIKKRS
jgi:hypothetical protein